MATPSPDTPAQMEIALRRSSASAKTLVRIDRVAGMMNAAPKPCTARMAITCSGVDACEQANDPTPKITRPMTRTGFRPRRSPVLPAISRKPAKTIVYASTIHCSWLEVAPSSRTSVGSATLTIVPSMPTTASARQRTPSTHQRRGSAGAWLASGAGRSTTGVATAGTVPEPRSVADLDRTRPGSGRAEHERRRLDERSGPVPDDEH